ncbi:MAG TPA: histidine kinase dimerization/phosphoacceptor domain -containing protein [Candidatus Omnitrophota bacterium]|nr:histidine kinase dimerization/phosphoacceptor domain -containing protein [Candidatus Omnitrophota bacterium]
MSPLSPPHRRRAGAELAIAWLSLFGLFAVVALFAFSIARDREDLIAAAVDRGRLESVLLADHAARLLEGADLALLTTIDDIRGLNRAEVSASRRLHDRFQRLADRLPFVEAIWFHGADGALWLTSLAFPAPPNDVSTADFHTIHRQDDRGVFVSALVGNSFRLSRRIETARGDFKGVASLTVDAGFFRRAYGTLGLPPGSTVTLLNARTLSPLVQIPEAKVEGATFHDVARLRQSIDVNSEQGTFRSISPIDRLERVYAYRKVPAFPLYLKVSVPLTTINDQWARQVRDRIATALGAIAGLGVLTWLGFRQAGQQRRFQESLSSRVMERTAQLEHAIQEVHHRVNNNLQIVGTLLTVQMHRVTDPLVRAALAEGVGRVSTIGLAHRVVYGNGAVTQLAFGDYLRSLAGQMADLYGFGTGAVEVAGDNPALPLETAVPLALMVHEVLAPGMRGGRRVRVELRADGPMWHLSATGLTPAADSMSGDIVGLLAGQLGAEIRSLPAPDGTVTFTASWPAA